MPTGYVIVLADVYCKWKKNPPRYRLFVNGELFVEREYVWSNEYLEEMIPIWVSPGDYTINYDLNPGSIARMEIKNLRIVDGPDNAKIINNILSIPA